MTTFREIVNASLTAEPDACSVAAALRALARELDERDAGLLAVLNDLESGLTGSAESGG